MVVARMSVWRFTSGNREAAFDLLNKNKAEEARKTRGYRGSMDLSSSDDPDSGVIITFWEDEDTREASAQGLFAGAEQDLEKYVAAPPEVKNYRLDREEIFIR